jgi:glycosyltransferase XagB
MADGSGYPFAELALDRLPAAMGKGCDAALIHRVGAPLCLQNLLLPWRQMGAVTLVLSGGAPPDARVRHDLEMAFGAIRLIPVPADACRQAILDSAGPGLVMEAEARLPAAQSCRQWDMGRARRRGVLALGLFALSLWFIPWVTVKALFVLVLLSLVSTSLLRILSALAALRAPRTVVPPTLDLPERLPIVSLFVPLFRETEIADALLKRLAALDYPSDRLDLCLILEEDDTVTRATLDAATLPPGAQIIAVPRGSVRTKPRAMNYALNFARGQIIGIYDAEDAPDPDQIRKVVRRFAETGQDLACLQGALDYYNSRSNWLARCFTLEYALWFRVLLPGVARLGLVVPLGGTTLFLRRSALRAMGGWDAHNVTEDADLGVRLARAGLRTEIIDTTTQEEANARLWPWVKQRSRWLKGYYVTWAVHMRDPAALLRDLGPWAFWGFQVQFLGALMQTLFAPVLWSFWFVALGLPHPMTAWLPSQWMIGLLVMFLALDAFQIVLAGMAAHRADKPTLVLWAPLLKFYFPLATIAAWIGFLETFTRPFYWHKTTHGIFQPSFAAPMPPPHPDADGSDRPG